jgi:hypothetical protein
MLVIFKESKSTLTIDYEAFLLLMKIVSIIQQKNLLDINNYNFF